MSDVKVYEAWKAYAEGDVWAVSLAGSTRAFITVYPEPGVITERRAAWIARELNYLEEKSAGQKEVRRG